MNKRKRTGCCPEASGGEGGGEFKGYVQNSPAAFDDEPRIQGDLERARIRPRVSSYAKAAEPEPEQRSFVGSALRSRYETRRTTNHTKTRTMDSLPYHRQRRRVGSGLALNGERQRITGSPEGKLWPSSTVEGRTASNGLWQRAQWTRSGGGRRKKRVRPVIEPFFLPLHPTSRSSLCPDRVHIPQANWESNTAFTRPVAECPKTRSCASTNL